MSLGISQVTVSQIRQSTQAVLPCLLALFHDLLLSRSTEKH